MESITHDIKTTWEHIAPAGSGHTEHVISCNLEKRENRAPYAGIAKSRPLRLPQRPADAPSGTGAAAQSGAPAQMASSSGSASGATSEVDDVIGKLLEVRGSRPGKQVNLTEAEIRNLCTSAREVFMSQPVLLELEAPIKICGARRTSLRSRATGRSALLTPCWRHTLLPLAYLCWHALTAAACCAS